MRLKLDENCKNEKKSVIVVRDISLKFRRRTDIFRKKTFGRNSLGVKIMSPPGFELLRLVCLLHSYVGSALLIIIMRLKPDENCENVFPWSCEI